jgi:hypothetical protein
MGRRRRRNTIPHPPTATAPPSATRQMTVIAQDPSVRKAGKPREILMARITVPAESLGAGPLGYRVQVVDYDASKRRFNGTHELPSAVSAEPAHWRSGHARIVQDYRFHAQNVYALVMKTLARFEFALGRRVGWSFDTHQLKIAPHGMLDANAFYSRAEEALVFGYFPGTSGDAVYTCLSHDVVVHETTHALIDALRERYMDPSSPDQGAFHEGFSDMIALLSVFSQPEVLQRLLLPRGASGRAPAIIEARRLTVPALRKSALFGLADQMGQEIQGARGEALRHSTDLPRDPRLLGQAEFQEWHRRGEVFVAAVMNGFIEAWAARIERAGLPGQKRFTVMRVAEEGADIADALATMWIRALDYMPPVHLEFADALSAALTADTEVRPDDSRFDLRNHVRRAFRAYGIKTPTRAHPETGTWQAAPKDLDYSRVRFDSLRSDADEVFRFVWENRSALELRDGAYTKVLSVRPCVRTGADGFVLRETVAEYYQVAHVTLAELAGRGIAVPAGYRAALRSEQQAAKRRRAQSLADLDAQDAADREERELGAEDDSLASTTPLHGGGVLIFDEFGRLKFHVHNDVFGKRQEKRLQHLWESGQLEATRDRGQLRAARLSSIHRMRALDARRVPAEGW